jgi:lipoate---protein ligase
MDRKFILTHSNDVYFNLAAEEYLVRNLDTSDTDYLLIYINEPSFILGKNQNIFAEINWDLLKNRNFKIARRISGGGAVYHDMGCLNYCFITQKDFSKVNNYEPFAGEIIRVLKSIDINCYLNPRNAIMLANDHKISGSAQFSTANNMLSHGTLLYDTVLKNIDEILIPNRFKIETKASKSVSSPVENLIQQYIDQVPDIIFLIESILHTLEYNEQYVLSEEFIKEIKKLSVEKYQSDDWNFHKAADGMVVVEGELWNIKDGVDDELGRLLDWIIR